MAYIPKDITFDPWASPISIDSVDYITDLDDAINDIITNDPQSLVIFINAQLAKLPPYLSSEMAKMYVEVEDSSLLAKAWATGTEPGGAGTYSSREFSEQAAISAGQASTSAGEASTSAGNALTSENNAKTSETNASTSETNAALSETNAANSAIEAADSAAHITNWNTSFIYRNSGTTTHASTLANVTYVPSPSLTVELNGSSVLPGQNIYGYCDGDFLTFNTDGTFLGDKTGSSFDISGSESVHCQIMPVDSSFLDDLPLILVRLIS